MILSRGFQVQDGFQDFLKPSNSRKTKGNLSETEFAGSSLYVSGILHGHDLAKSLLAAAATGHASITESRAVDDQNFATQTLDFPKYTGMPWAKNSDIGKIQNSQDAVCVTSLVNEVVGWRIEFDRYVDCGHFVLILRTSLCDRHFKLEGDLNLLVLKCCCKSCHQILARNRLPLRQTPLFHQHQ
jgi:hypothetical protein